MTLHWGCAGSFLSPQTPSVSGPELCQWSLWLMKVWKHWNWIQLTIDIHSHGNVSLKTIFKPTKFQGIHLVVSIRAVFKEWVNSKIQNAMFFLLKHYLQKCMPLHPFNRTRWHFTCGAHSANLKLRFIKTHSRKK